MNWISEKAWHIWAFRINCLLPLKHILKFCFVWNFHKFILLLSSLLFFFLKKLKKDQMLIRLSVDKEAEKNLFFLSQLLLFFLFLLSMRIDWFKFLFSWNILDNPHVVLRCVGWKNDDFRMMWAWNVSDSYWNFQSNSFFPRNVSFEHKRKWIYVERWAILQEIFVWFKIFFF